MRHLTTPPTLRDKRLRLMAELIAAKLIQEVPEADITQERLMDLGFTPEETISLRTEAFAAARNIFAECL